MAYVITSPCIDVKSRSCVEECPIDCIYEGARMMYIHPGECVDCGACEAVCPVEAIHYIDDVPPDQQKFIVAASEFVAILPTVGGASRVGPQNFDAPGLFAGSLNPLDLPHVDVLGELTRPGRPAGAVALVYAEPAKPWARDWAASDRSHLEALSLFYERVIVLRDKGSAAAADNARVEALIGHGAILLADSDLWIAELGNHLLNMVRYINSIDASELSEAMANGKWDGPQGTLFVRLQEAAMGADSEFGLLDWMPPVRHASKVLLLHLIRLVAADRGLALDPVCFDIGYMRSLRVLCGDAGATATNWWELEHVMPETGHLPIEDLLAFRAENLHRYSAHITLLRSIMARDPAARSMAEWVRWREEISDSAHSLRTLLFGDGLKHWLIGGFGDFATIQSRDSSPSIARGALAAAATEAKADMLSFCLMPFNGALDDRRMRRSDRVR